MEQNKLNSPWWREIIGIAWPIIAAFVLLKIVTIFYSPSHVDRSEIERAWKSNDLVLLEFHASWCSTCLIQRNVLNDIFKNPEFAGIRRFTLNYDVENQLKREFRVSSQSTLILTRNGKELSRSVGVVNPSDLKAFLKN